MPRGWLAAPVIGTGTDDDPFRASVADRESVEGDRLEFVIDSDKPTCLVGYEVADDSDMADHGGDLLLAEADLDKAADRVTRASKLDALAREAKVGRTGSAREVLRRVGQTISPTFDERLHLGSGKAPPTGSFVVDTFTDSDGTDIEDHTGETGASWSAHPESAGGVVKIDSNGYIYNDDSSSALLLASGSPASAEYSVACSTVFASSQGWLSALARYDDTDDTGYQFRQLAFGGGTAFRIYKFDAGSATTLGQYVGSNEDVDLDGEVTDAAKKLFVNGTERISTSNNDITDAGSVGVHLGFNYATGSYQLDSITATDAGGATVEAAASGAGAGTGSASASATRLASAAGTGAGTGAASAVRVQPAAGSGSGSGAGSASASAIRLATASGAGVGAGQAGASAVRLASASGSGAGTGSATAATVALASQFDVLVRSSKNVAIVVADVGRESSVHGPGSPIQVEVQI